MLGVAELVGARRAQCAAEVGIDFKGGTAQPVARGDTDKLREIFNRYASVHKSGLRFMTADDFVRKYLGLYTEGNYNRRTVELVGGAADTTKDGLISFEEFKAFESILCAPDALYLTAFEMFDTNGSTTVTFDEFRHIIRHTTPLVDMDFDFDSDFIKLYFGNDKRRAIGYLDFCQLLHDFYEEQGLQAFKKYDKSGSGFITAVDFQRIMTSVKSHLMTDFVRDNLVAVAGGTVSHMVSYPYYTAFNSLLSKMEMFKRIYQTMTKGNLQIEVTQESFLLEAQSYAQLTPSEVKILFHLANIAHPGKKTLSFEDFERVDPERLKRVTYMTQVARVRAVKSRRERGVLMAVLENVYRFTLGSVAGAVGATAVYPIDLVKTRMQNQRISRSFVGETLYRNSFDCFRKVVRHEGLLGLYRGLLPQIFGVAPEKAIKLTTNDFVREKLTFRGHLPLWGEVIAGGCGGASQVLFTNPIEIVKIRLQVAGEISGGARVSVWTVLRELGVWNLYRGARACFLRDIPFSAIYFPVYAHAKLSSADADGHNNPATLFASAFIAGVPAAALVTPADVIKTRLQVAARAGQTTYSGLFDCYRKIVREEGFRALWKGSGARVCRSSPQFAFTLLTYELLQRAFYVDFGGARPAGSEVPVHTTLRDRASLNPDHIGGFRLAGATFAGIESKFGLLLPKFQTAPADPT